MIRALSVASTGMAAQQLTVEVIANNLANVSTTGFKKSAWNFQDLLYHTVRAAGTTTDVGTTPVGIQLGSGVRAVSVHRSFKQGDFRETDSPLDLAIEGEGFFQVSLPDGTSAYTRTGSFKMDSEGNVVTSEGYPILPNISVPANTQTLTVGASGDVSALTAGSTTATVVGTIELARFINPAGLNSLGKNLYQETAASSSPTTGTPGLDGLGTLLQGALEGSNVNIAEEMVSMIVAQRAYELNSKAIQTSDEMMGIANNLKR